MGQLEGFARRLQLLGRRLAVAAPSLRHFAAAGKGWFSSLLLDAWLSLRT